MCVARTCARRRKQLRQGKAGKLAGARMKVIRDGDGKKAKKRR